MQDILNGIFPLTADAAVDNADNTDTTIRQPISNQGILSQDINFPGASGPCASRDTAYFEPLPDASIQHIRAALTGKFSPLLNGCFGLDYGDKKPIARGFVTVDTVTQCTTLFPNEPGYASGGVLDNRNILWGDYQVLDKTKKIARADALVHIRSGMSFPDNDPQVTMPASTPSIPASIRSPARAFANRSRRSSRRRTRIAARRTSCSRRARRSPCGAIPRCRPRRSSRAARGPRGSR